MLFRSDDFAHGGKYDLYLKSANYTDGFFKILWDWCQSEPQYKGKTTMIITCDHGRGSVNKGDWRDHGINMPAADQIWIAVIGPDTPATGEVKDSLQLYQNQVAKTIATLLRLDYKNEPEPGAAIRAIFGQK